MSFNKISIKYRLWFPVFILLTIIAFTGGGYILLLGDISNSKSTVEKLNSYISSANKAQISLIKFTDGHIPHDELLPDLLNLGLLPNELHQRLSKDKVEEIIEQSRQIDSLILHSEKVQREILSLTNASIEESNSYFPYIVDKLENSTNEVSKLEINTIIGASNNSNSNFKIQTLFLTMTSTPSVYEELVTFINQSIQNAKADAIALSGTKFEASPLKALEINHTVLDKVNDFRSLQIELNTKKHC